VKVTLHVPPGETITGLRRVLAELAPGAPLRGVSGRAGVLVDADLALAYLLHRAGGDCRLAGAGLLVIPDVLDLPANGAFPDLPEVDETPAATETTPVPSEAPGEAAEAVVVAPKPPQPAKPAAKKTAAKKTVKEG